LLGGIALSVSVFAGLLTTKTVRADDQSVRQTEKQDVQKGDSIDRDAPLVSIVEKRETIPFSTQRKDSSELRAGTSKTVRVGVEGVKLVQYKVVMQNGVETNKEVVSSKVLKQPQTEVVAVGRKTQKFASRGGYFSGKKVISMVATGYSPSPRENGGSTSGRTALGLKIGHGVVAVDPKYIPLGTRLFIEGYGNAVAADTGGSIKGNRIDLGHDTYRAAQAVGRRTVKVHILD